MIAKNQVSFEDFIAYFPSIELPIVLTDTSASEFSKFNQPFSGTIVEKYFNSWDKKIDEFTEYIPCFRIPDTGNFIAIVYYKATLLNYGFYIVSFDLKGNFISYKPLNNIHFENNLLSNAVTFIDEDWIIKIVAGEQDLDKHDYNPENSKITSLEILPTGDIINRLAE